MERERERDVIDISLNVGEVEETRISPLTGEIRSFEIYPKRYNGNIIIKNNLNFSLTENIFFEIPAQDCPQDVIEIEKSILMNIINVCKSKIKNLENKRL